MQRKVYEESWSVKMIRVLFVGLVLCAVAATRNAQAQAPQFCGPMDVVLVVDDTGSMGPAIENVKVGLTNIIAAAEVASGGDVRFGLVTFGVGIRVDRPLTCAIEEITSAVNGLAASGGNNEPEDSDEALRYVVTGAAAPTCAVSEPRGPLGAFRSGALKIVVLITDATPAGCDDQYADGVDDTNAAEVASLAANAGILISAILVDNGSVVSAAHPGGVEPDVMQAYAAATGGLFSTVPAAGTGTGDAIQDIVASCGGGGPVVGNCITRTARFWFAHPSSTDPQCVTLKRALEDCNGIGIGFLSLPTAHRTPDTVRDAEDALIEALGLFWRSSKRTGEDGGTQGRKIKASALCRARKQLAVELIAATANRVVLGTAPGNCTYFNGVSVTNFPPDLIQQARRTAAGDSVEQAMSMTLLLRKFNSSGQTNDFPVGLVECSASSRKALRDLSRDPTTKFTCPGPNDSCEAAEAVVFPSSSDIFDSPSLSRRVNLTAFTDDFPGTPSCGTGGRDAVWKITPTIGRPGRRFTVDTFGSNFDTLLSLWRGSCASLEEIACNDDADSRKQSTASFSTDGTNTYYIVIEGANGNYGNVRLKITSP